MTAPYIPTQRKLFKFHRVFIVIVNFSLTVIVLIVLELLQTSIRKRLTIVAKSSGIDLNKNLRYNALLN
jgi:hypothetical protein